MGNLADDTAVEGGDGAYRAALSADLAIWGPNGGYLAAVALRAVGAHTGLTRPASFSCHFLGVADFDEVELSVATLRAGRRAESVRVSMTQRGEPVLEGLAWVVADGLDGLAHDDLPAPAVAPPHDLASREDQLAPDAPRFSFFDNLDERPLAWIPDWEAWPGGDPEFLSWFRFRPRAAFEDPFVDAGRLAILVDTFMWPAAHRGHAPATLPYIAPSIDLACRFHRPAAGAEWLLVRAHSPVADGGLVGGTACVWDEAGRLLASGGQQMLCRPAPPRD